MITFCCAGAWHVVILWGSLPLAQQGYPVSQLHRCPLAGKTAKAMGILPPGDPQRGRGHNCFGRVDLRDPIQVDYARIATRAMALAA